ncbi:hypothetical protein M436DRAFT_64127 [Aureobasidium namibiae CBS 147.97]|uniref:Secreted protein n=1 Tax=Aureobasidium namibiae CBS 147.97 TaxID=1043004 RepID=A0A074XEB9_9PEZI|nr:uncharacterized protein M436DRAFT_64127 [Aureobasidium namibiae CBS 147.97]KEQ72961.1 hypothetical protein M436DRAFT_64127 [Aureobasidium namibiae CBS 147.97]
MAQSRRWRKVMVLLSYQVLLARDASSQDSHTTPRPAQPLSAWRHHRDTTERADSLCGCRRAFYITTISSKKRASLYQGVRGVRSIGRRTRPDRGVVWVGKLTESVKTILESDGASREKLWTSIMPSLAVADVRALQKRQASTSQSFCPKQERTTSSRVTYTQCCSCSQGNLMSLLTYPPIFEALKVTCRSNLRPHVAAKDYMFITCRSYSQLCSTTAA